MKRAVMKLAVAAVAVALCGAAEAGDVLYWQVWYVNPPSESSATLSVGSYLAYLFDGTKYDNVLSVLSGKDVTHETLASLSRDWEANTWHTTKNTTQWVVNETVSDVSTIPKSAFAVILDANESTFDQAKHYMIARQYDNSTQTLTENEIVSETTLSYGNDTYHRFVFGPQNSNTWYEIGTIPEPTSGLLLLVGLSALALKRKCAA